MTKEELYKIANAIVTDPRGMRPGTETDETKLARYVQRMMDSTPADLEWVKQFGKFDSSYGTYRFLSDGYLLYVNNETGNVGCNSYSLGNNPTRGQVRQLCAALGIELREGE